VGGITATGKRARERQERQNVLRRRLRDLVDKHGEDVIVQQAARLAFIDGLRFFKEDEHGDTTEGATMGLRYFIGGGACVLWVEEIWQRVVSTIRDDEDPWERAHLVPTSEKVVRPTLARSTARQEIMADRARERKQLERLGDELEREPNPDLEDLITVCTWVRATTPLGRMPTPVLEALIRLDSGGANG
jgi:hypothetical protein